MEKQALDSRGVVAAIMDYEAGELDDEGVVILFQYLVDTGMAWTLQGHYGRVAEALIEAGLVDEH